MRISKPLWQEGILLLPQLFQQQECSLLAGMRQLERLATPFGWGLERLRIDESALLQQKLKIDDIAGRLPDGTWFDSALCGNPPVSRDVSMLPEGQMRTEVWLVLPELNPQGNNLQDDRTPDTPARRFSHSYHRVPDLTGEQTDEMAVEQLNLSLRFDHERREGCSGLPIARLHRTAQGAFSLHHPYIPPLLNTEASPHLLAQLEQWVKLLEVRQRDLREQRRERNHLASDYLVSDVGLFWLLNTVNQAWPELRARWQHPAQSPYSLYLVMARLAGALSAFSLEHSLSSIPAYHHQRLEDTFRSLDQLIRELLNTVIPAPVVILNLEKQSATRWLAILRDSRLREHTDFYLSARSGLPMHQLQEQLPKVSKAGAPDDVAQILPSALNGIPLRPVQRIPSALPARAENVYFALDSQHPGFGRMLAAQTCALYVPATIPELHLELYAVPRS